MARVQQLLDKWKPWLQGHGILLTPHKDVETTHPAQYDMAEIGSQGIGDVNGDRYPWVLGVDVEHGQFKIGQALRWMVDHVGQLGLVIVDVPRDQYEPGTVVDMVRLAWQYAWFITAEIDGDRTTVIAADMALKPNSFLIDNRSEVGDTFSCGPLVDELRLQYPNAKIAIRNDQHGLFPDLPEYDPKTAYQGIIHQDTTKYEYGDFYRRAFDFYAYPLKLAHELGYIEKFDPYPQLPKLDFDLDDQAVWKSVKADLKKAVDPIVIATNTNLQQRDWPISRWAHVIDWLIENGQQIVLVGRDKIPIRGMRRYTKRKFRDVRGKTTVRQMAYIVSKAKLVITPDTAVAHFAQSEDVPALILQGPTAGAPLFRYSDTVVSVSRPDKGCVNCYQKCDPEKPYRNGQQEALYFCGAQGPTMPCMAKILVSQLTDILRQHLGIETAIPTGLSVCMMVKNEETVIKECIETAILAADEVIVVDTGCTDKTMEIIKEADEDVGIVKIFKDDKTGFENGQICDYAAARNGTFSKATMKYVLWMDAGDRLSEPEKLRELVLKEEADVIQMQTVFGDDSYWRERVVPRGMCLWKDRVHETIDIGELNSLPFKDCVVNHIGTKKVGREGSLERNIRLLKRMVDENDETHDRYGRWCYYLARELKHSNKKYDAIPFYEKAIQTCRFWEEKMQSTIDLSRIYMDLRDYKRVLTLAYDGLKTADGWREPYYMAGDAYYWMGNYPMAAAWYQHCAQIPRPQTVLWLWEDLYTWLPYCQLAYCFEKMGQRDAAIKYAELEVKACPPEQRGRAEKHLAELRGQS